MILDLIANFISAALGAGIGAVFALRKFKNERAFDRRLEWYENILSAIHKLSFHASQGINADNPHRMEDLKIAISAFQDFILLEEKAALYGNKKTVGIFSSGRIRLQERRDKIMEALQANDEASDAAFSDAINEWYTVIDEMSKEVAPEVRKHLGFENL